MDDNGCLKLKTADWLKLIGLLIGQVLALVAIGWSTLNTINYRITVLETNQIGILRVLEEFEGLSRDISKQLGAGILPESRRRLDDLDIRARGIEKSLHDLEKEIITIRQKISAREE